MKKTKGFTLIELLTVIAILAVVLLLAVPSILKVLENSKKEAAKDSALVYIREVNRKNQENLTYGNPIITGEELDILEEEYLQNLGISGTLPTQGIITITKLGKVESANLCVNGYNVEYDKDETKVTTKCGEIKNPYQTTDTTPGDLACKTIEGIRNCYIESIEDLVVFSDIVNGTNGKTQDSFENTIIKLETSLDIKKIESYATTNKWTYDINENSVLEDLKTELTTGKGFKPIGNNTNKFKGTLEGNANTIANLYINRSGESYVGLFGYNSGIIKGLNIELIDITAHEYLGGIAGYNIGTISEISITGSIKIDGISNYNSYTGGIAGYNHRLETTNAATIKNVIVNMNISGGLYTGGIVGQSTGYSVSYPAIVEGIVEGGSVTGNTNYTSLPYGYTPNTTANVYVSTTAVGKSNALAHIFNGTNDINGYEGVIDTWIGGDNDSSGYYFDYTKDKTDIIVKSIKNDKMTFNLDGSGTEEDPYLITNEKTWKIATLNVKEIDTYYKLMSDLDFSSSKFYMMGGKNNYFQGKLDGNNYTIKNITINGYEYLGITGYNAGEIKGLHVSNINITGQTRIGSLAGYNIGTLSSSNISTTIVGHEYLGGVVGYNTGTVNEVNVTGSIGIDVEATNYYSYIGGIAGYNQCLKTTDIAIIKNAIVNMNISGGVHTGGIVGYSTGYSGSYPAIVEGIVEGGSVTGNASYAYAPYGRIINTTVKIYVNNSISTISAYGTTYFEPTNVNDLTYYGNILNTALTGDNDSSGYYFNYNQDNTDIVVVPSN